MMRAVTVAACMVAGVAVGHAANNFTITTVAQCNQMVTSLEGQIKSSLAAIRAVDVARNAVEQMKTACTAGDLVTASNAATGARGILAVE